MSTTRVGAAVWGAVLAALLAALSAPADALAQGPTPYPENQPFVNASGSSPGRRPGQGLDLSVSLFGGVNVGGRERLAVVTPAVEERLAPAFALGGRVELSTSRYVAVGVFVDYVRTELLFLREAPEPNVVTRTGMLGLGVWMKLRAPLTLGRAPAELYLGVPLGMGVLRPPKALGGDPEFGVVFGGLGGLQVQATEHVGLFVEAGLRASRFDEMLVGFRQASVHVGAAYAF